MEINKILKLINEKSNVINNIFSSKTGKEFEERILSQIVNDGYYISLPNDEFKSLESFNEVKHHLLSDKYDGDFYHNNKLEIISSSPRVVFQPFGSQNSPDLLLINKGKCLPIEIKYTKSNKATPVWNSGLPRTRFLYIFGSYGLKDVVFFKGSDIITKIERVETIDLVKQYKQKLSQEGKRKISNFEIYLRPMYNQKGNIWNSEDRSSYQKEALDWGVKF